MITHVDYDHLAGTYASRYERTDYGGISRALARFAEAPFSSSDGRVLDIGCGTGHWLQNLRDTGLRVVGLDRSTEMLRVARSGAMSPVVRGLAETLPVQSASVDRIVCVHALHHFSDPDAFFLEARRVLRPGGGLLILGLDPHAGRDRWWVYDHFPEALVVDLGRYLPSQDIRRLMASAGFSRSETLEVQHLPGEIPASEAAGRGLLDRSRSSQLMVISDEAYQSGLDRILKTRSDDGGELMLRSSLRVYGTVGWC